MLIQTRTTVPVRWLWLSLLSVLLALDAFGAKPPYSTVSEYLIDTWETEDGLPENSATAMAQTPDGYLWFGTFKGLVRFNGATFRVTLPVAAEATKS